MNRQDYFGNGDDPYEAGDEQYEECEVCHQEFTGTCPINSADCPYADFIDDDEDDAPDFEDVENLNELLEDDEEVEKLLEEEDGEIPDEDLVDERGGAEETDETPAPASPPPKASKPAGRKSPTKHKK